MATICLDPLLLLSEHAVGRAWLLDVLEAGVASIDDLHLDVLLGEILDGRPVKAAGTSAAAPIHGCAPAASHRGVGGDSLAVSSSSKSVQDISDPGLGAPVAVTLDEGGGADDAVHELGILNLGDDDAGQEPLDILRIGDVDLLENVTLDGVRLDAVASAADVTVTLGLVSGEKLEVEAVGSGREVNFCGFTLSGEGGVKALDGVVPLGKRKSPDKGCKA